MKNAKNYSLSKNIIVLNLQKELYENRLINLSAELEICSSYKDKVNDDSKGLLYLLTCMNSIEEAISNVEEVLEDVENEISSLEKEFDIKGSEIKGELENV